MLFFWDGHLSINFMLKKNAFNYQSFYSITLIKMKPGKDLVNISRLKQFDNTFPLILFYFQTKIEVD